MSENPILSVVSPVYRAERIIDELVKRIVSSVETITPDFEIILVEDGSPDGSWKKIEENCRLDYRVKGIKLSRNFGQHYAITAGIQASRGNYVVVMDCDLQDDPIAIPALFDKACEGFSVVLASRIARTDSFLKKQFSILFYKLLGYLTETRQDFTVANFGIYHREVINAILSMKDSLKYFPTMVQWVGFSQALVEVKHGTRYEGKTSYSFRRLLHLALNNILSFSEKPLRLTVKVGFFISLSSILFTLYILYRYVAGEAILIGWTSLIVSIWFLSGIIISVLGVVGLYIGKTFNQVKDRPVYIIEKRVNE